MSLDMTTTPRPRAGRPELPAAERLSELVQVTVTPDTIRRLDRQARLLASSRAAIIRHALDGLLGALDHASTQPPTASDLTDAS